MAKIIVALIYMCLILAIGFASAKKVKTAEDFATAGKQIPFWTNVYSMASAQIGAGATMGVASMAYQFGFSGMVLGFGAAAGAILSGLIFAKKIREANVTTIPELIRNRLGERVANMICILTIVQVFGILAGQVRSLGTILQIFIPSLSLLNAIIIMSVIMMIYSVIGGMVAATSTDKLNVSIMIISVMVITPIVAMTKVGGTRGIALNLAPDKLSLTNMGIPTMISTFLYFGLMGMINNENFLRICGAKNAREAKRATLMAALAIYLPYMIFAGLIGIMGILLIPELGTSDSIIPAMIDKTTGDLTGAFLLSGLLAAVMGTAASVAMATSITFTRDVVKRIKKDMDGKQVLLTQRASLVVFTILAIIIGYQGSSIVTIMEDVGAPCVAALIPIFFGMFFWKKTNPKGAAITIGVAVISTIGYWLMGSPLGISHFLVGLTCSAVSLFVSCSFTYKGVNGQEVL